MAKVRFTRQIAACHGARSAVDGARTVLAMSMMPSALHTTMASSMVMLVRKVGLEPSACRAFAWKGACEVRAGVWGYGPDGLE